MSWLSSFLSPGKGYKKGQEQLDRYYQDAQRYQQPFIEHGEHAWGGLGGAMDKLFDPAALQGEWLKSYETSPAAKNAQEMSMQSGLNALSSMGLVGSTPGLTALQRGSANIAMEDRQNYLNDLMQKYLAGAGIAQNIYGIGAGAAQNMAGNAMNMGQNSAQMAYGRQNAGGNMLGGLIGAGLGLAGSAMGGPMGGAMAKRWNIGG